MALRFDYTEAAFRACVFDSEPLEVADVGQATGSFIAAPAYDTPAGWQPSILEPGRHGSQEDLHQPSLSDPATP
jgi:hypothetical protein